VLWARSEFAPPGSSAPKGLREREIRCSRLLLKLFIIWKIELRSMASCVIGSLQRAAC
jgi:hypothetical protein